MKIAIMQPYFFPYIGYFQLMNLVDEFVIYDNIQYTKKGWINRNRILTNNGVATFSLTIKKDSDYLDVVNRKLADAWRIERKKMLNKIKEAYRKAPYFNEVYPLLENCILYENFNLFNFIYHSLEQVKEFLEINTKFVISSSININHSLRAKEKVIEICKARNAKYYINPIGGTELYNKNDFSTKKINLQFIKTANIEYTQFKNEFVPFLSMIDVMMFNSKDKVQDCLKLYTIL